MKRIISSVIILLSVLTMATSCLNDNDDDNVVYYDDTAVTSFSLATLKREMHTTSSTGEDSTYWTTVDCSSYKFYINQATREIYNADSLPTGTYLKKALCNISTKNSGIALINLKENDSDDDNYTYIVSTDSIDLSVDREIRVFNSQQTAYRTYTLKVNVHQEEAETFRWTQVAHYDNFAATTHLKGARIGSLLLLLEGRETSTRMHLMDVTTMEWSAVDIDFDAEAWQNLVATDSKAYTIANGYIQTIDANAGAEWQQGTPANDISMLVGAVRNALYAIDNTGRLVVSTDEGASWSRAKTDNSTTLLPQTDIHMVSLPLLTNRDTYTLLLLGNNANIERGSVVWATIDETQAQPAGQEWFYYDQAEDNTHLLPVMNNLQAVAYDGAVLTFGSNETISAIYESRDRGLTWWKSETYTLPTTFQPTTEAYTMTVDAANCIWIVSAETGNVWRGRLNRLGWKNN